MVKIQWLGHSVFRIFDDKAIVIGGSICTNDIDITMTEAKHSSDMVDAGLPGGLMAS